MKGSILVDTSAWIDYFNKSDSEIGGWVEQLIKEGKAVVAGVVLTELLQGAKVRDEFDEILQSLVALPLLETTFNTWVTAGRISFDLRRKGITIPTTDLIIAGLAIENECRILTLDPHFKSIPGLDRFTGPKRKVQ